MFRSRRCPQATALGSKILAHNIHTHTRGELNANRVNRAPKTKQIAKEKEREGEEEEGKKAMRKHKSN